jgi:hypothetical protein
MTTDTAQWLATTLLAVIGALSLFILKGFVARLSELGKRSHEHAQLLQEARDNAKSAIDGMDSHREDDREAFRRVDAHLDKQDQRIDQLPERIVNLIARRIPSPYPRKAE